MDQQQFLPYYDNDYNAEDYYDTYYNEVDDDSNYFQPNIDGDVYSEHSFWSNMSFYQLYTQFIIPAVWSTCSLLGATLILCIFFRLIIVISNRFKVFPEVILHAVCAVCGVLPLVLFQENGDLQQFLLQIVLFPLLCYIASLICILCFKRYYTIVFSAVILLILFYCECFSDDLQWQKNKSAHMLMSMKAMAVLFDLKSDELHTFPSLSQYIGYMLCAGTFYLGPFLSFQEYCNAFFLPVCWNIAKVFNVMWKIIFSLGCFVLSICVVDWLLGQNVYTGDNSNTITSSFIMMYKRALEFRTGHYFIAFASTAFAMICGYHSNYNNEILVTRPVTVEWPQSLLHVVIYWNAPMHRWLKKYVFEEVLKFGNKNRKHKNKIFAIGMTYFVSSLLHGLERRLSAVLLSLAAYTYVEHQLRTKLALRFPRTFSYYSKKYRHHKTMKYIDSVNKNTFFMWCINLMFTLLNIIHLAYLGSIMDMSGNSVSNYDSFAPWRQVSFFSHFIMLFMYFISIIL